MPPLLILFPQHGTCYGRVGPDTIRSPLRPAPEAQRRRSRTVDHRPSVAPLGRVGGAEVTAELPRATAGRLVALAAPKSQSAAQAPWESPRLQPAARLAQITRGAGRPRRVTLAVEV